MMTIDQPAIKVSSVANSALFPSDVDLLLGCRAGDERSWQRLLDKYERLVYSIPLNCGLSQDDAADIAQIAFTALLQCLDSLRDDSNLGGWLAVVARRHTWRVLRQRRREPIAELDHQITAALVPGRADAIERWELTEWLHRNFSLMDDRCRRLLIALYFDPTEPSYLEIAHQLGIAEGSIGPIRARCLQRLRELLMR